MWYWSNPSWVLSGLSGSTYSLQNPQCKKAFAQVVAGWNYCFRFTMRPQNGNRRGLICDFKIFTPLKLETWMRHQVGLAAPTYMYLSINVIFFTVTSSDPSRHLAGLLGVFPENNTSKMPYIFSKLLVPNNSCALEQWKKKSRLLQKS
jgi:hypothetical protein